MNWRQDVGRTWNDDDRVRLQMARIAPVLMVRVMYATSLLLAGAARATGTARSNSETHIRVPRQLAQAFREQVRLVDDVIHDERMKFGGVMIPLEGAPWTGRREDSMTGNGGNPRSMETEYIVWKQLLVASLGLCDEIDTGLATTDNEDHILVSNRRMAQVYGMYTCPLLSAWEPTKGFRYGEVRACLAVVNGRRIDERSYAVLDASSKVPEARIMPLPGEVRQFMDGAMPSHEKRNEARRTLNDPSRRTAFNAEAAGQMSLFGQSTDDVSKDPSKAEKQPVLQPSLAF